MTERPRSPTAIGTDTTEDTARYEPYPTYRDSGVEWLGKIPSHWEVKKSSRLFAIGSGTTPPTDYPEYYGGGVPWITTSELRESVVTSTEKSVTKQALRAFSALNLYPERSIAVAMYGATIGRLGILGISAAVNQACCVFSKPESIDVWFWFYWLQFRRPYLISLGYGGGQPNLSQELLKSIRVPIPPLHEQRNIVYTLDRETAKLDELVAKKERLIELLQEKRSALITQAVTKGIDPDAPMKDSGVEWLADIPERWNTARMWQLSEAISGGTPSRDEPRNWGGLVPWVSPKDMKCRLLDDTEEKITERGRTEGGIRLVRPPAVLIVVRGMILAHSFPVALASVPLTINQDMKALKLGEGVDERYFGWLLNGIAHQILGTVIEKSGHGTRTVRMDEWRSVELPLPPILEQQSIADFLDRETSEVDVLLAKVHEAVDRLKELRTALIAAAVTGKIDVRETPA